MIKKKQISLTTEVRQIVEKNLDIIDAMKKLNTKLDERKLGRKRNK